MNKDCEKMERLISDRLDSEISPTDEAALQAHLNHCEECRRFEESARFSRERLRSLPDAAVDTPRFHSPERLKNKGRFWGGRISMRVPVAAVLAVLMLTGWIMALMPGGKAIETSSSRPVLAQSVEIIKAQPAQVSLVNPDLDNSSKKKEDET